MLLMQESDKCFDLSSMPLFNPLPIAFIIFALTTVRQHYFVHGIVADDLNASGRDFTTRFTREEHFEDAGFEIF